MHFDQGTGLLDKISVKTKPVSALMLTSRWFQRESGIYEPQNINDIDVAITLQRNVAKFLNFASSQIDDKHPIISYIDGNQRHYYSEELRIPNRFLSPEEPLTHDYYQSVFQVKASNIAGRFGLDLRDIEFDERGIPRHIGILPGNACFYYLDPNDRRDGTYGGHNVDTPYQAVALHSIGAMFINDMLDRETRLAE